MVGYWQYVDRMLDFPLSALMAVFPEPSQNACAVAEGRRVARDGGILAIC